MIIQCVGNAIIIYQGDLGRSFIGGINECCDEISRVIKENEAIVVIPIGENMKPRLLFNELKSRGMNPKFLRYVNSSEREAD